MRLSAADQDAIRSAVRAQDPGARIILFGSRVDDRARGGDIDLLVISDRVDFRGEWRVRRDILDQLGWQKLDLIVVRSDELDSGIARLALESGIPL
jgi:predicted nucleotidyltransferase